MCPKKYKEVFQQLNQYDVFVGSTDKNTVKKNVCNGREVREPNVIKVPKIYKPVYPSMITQVIMFVLQLNHDKHFNQEN